jgi:hypothetical protein
LFIPKIDIACRNELMVEFSYRELAADMRSFAEKETKFLSPATPNLMREAAGRLVDASHAPQQTAWTVEDTSYSRLETAVSVGESELGNNVAWTLKGGLSFRWDIVRSASGRNPRFRILNATTRLTLLICSQEGDVAAHGLAGHAVWRFEIGDPHHPGTLFHSQVDWPTVDDRRLEVPRLPSIVLTPVEALDFLLGELFQVRWPQEQLGAGWQSTQRARLLKFLGGAADTVKDATNGRSALMSLKAWKPDFHLME